MAASSSSSSSISTRYIPLLDDLYDRHYLPERVYFTKNITTLICNYLGKCNEGFDRAYRLLEREVVQGKERMLQYPDHAYLQGEFGLTGVCLAFALKVPEHLAKYRSDSFMPYPLPPLMPARPSEQIRHLEKLLILSAFKVVPCGSNPESIKESPEHATAINAMATDYLQLQAPLTGLHCGTPYPGPNFSNTLSMTEQLTAFRRFAATDEGEGHGIFILRQPNESILSWHVIYVNGKLGIIADAASTLLWQADSATHKYFFDLFAAFCAKRYYLDYRATWIPLTYRALPGCRMPLLLSRIARRTQTACMVGAKLGFVKACEYVMAIHQHNSVIERCRRGDTTILERLTKALFAHKDPLKLTFTYVRNHLDVFGRYRAKGLDLNLDHFKNAIWGKLMDLLEDPSCATELLVDLDRIQKLGPKADFITSALLKSLIYSIPTNRPIPSHIVNNVLPSLLKMHKDLATPFDLDCAINQATVCVDALPYYKQLFEAGANINGSKLNYSRGDAPLHVALTSETVLFLSTPAEVAQIVKFFRDRSALEPGMPWK